MIDPKKDYSDAKWSRLYKDYQIKYAKASQDYNMHPMYSFDEFKNTYIDVAREREDGIEKNKIIKDIVRSTEKRETYKVRKSILGNISELRKMRLDEIEELEFQASRIGAKKYNKMIENKTQKEIEEIDKELEKAQKEKAKLLHEKVEDFLEKTKYDGSERWSRFYGADFRALLESLELGDWSIYFNS